MNKIASILYLLIILMLQACLTDNSGGNPAPIFQSSSSANLISGSSSSNIKITVSSDTTLLYNVGNALIQNTFESFFTQTPGSYHDSDLVKQPTVDTIVAFHTTKVTDSSVTIVNSKYSTDSIFHANGPKNVSFLRLGSNSIIVTNSGNNKKYSQHTIDSIYNANISNGTSDSLTLKFNENFMANRQDGYIVLCQLYGPSFIGDYTSMVCTEHT